jgi:hypothetical protein
MDPSPPRNGRVVPDFENLVLLTMSAQDSLRSRTPGTLNSTQSPQVATPAPSSPSASPNTTPVASPRAYWQGPRRITIKLNVSAPDFTDHCQKLILQTRLGPLSTVKANPSKRPSLKPSSSQVRITTKPETTMTSPTPRRWLNTSRRTSAFSPSS